MDIMAAFSHIRAYLDECYAMVVMKSSHISACFPVLLPTGICLRVF